MKKLDLYLIKKFVGPFVAVLFIVIFTLSMQFLWRYISELVGKGLGIGVILEFLGWAACTLIPNAVPLATLLASIMTLGGLGERNELLAMKAAGVSLQRIITPLALISILISVGAFFAADRLVPIAYNKVYTLRADILRTRDEIKILTRIFYDGIDGYILRVEDRNDQTGMMYDLIVYDHTSNSGNNNMTVADSGRIEITPNKQNLIFTLYSGCTYAETNKMNYRDTTLDLNRLRFEEQQLIISLDNYQFSRSETDNYGDEIRTFGLRRLNHDRDSLARQLDTLIQHQFPRFLNATGMSYFYQLDTIKADSDFKGDFNADSLRATLSPVQLRQASRMALDNSQTGGDQIKQQLREASRYVDLIRRIDIEAFLKFTLSLSCLLFFFVGAPLGAIIRKGGLGTPVVISIFFYLIYYIIDIIGRKLAKSGTLTPLEGTLISTLILLPIGILLTRKSTQDSSLFNPDSYKEFFRTI